MKLTLIRTDRETGKESFSTLEAENLIAKIKKENKAAHVSALRHLIPILQGTNNHYQSIDKLPRIYPAVEYARTKDGEHRVKIYNGPRLPSTTSRSSSSATAPTPLSPVRSGRTPVRWPTCSPR